MLAEEWYLRQPVVGDAPVGHHICESRERIEGNRTGVFARIGCHECRDEHIATHGVHAAHLGVEGLIGIGCSREETFVGVGGALVLAHYAVGNGGDIAKELVECVAVVAVVCRRTSKCGGNSAVRFGVASRICGGHLVVHELYLRGAVVSAVACEHNLQPLDWLEVEFK